MPKPPKDPDYFDKVNYVIDSWAQPCDAPWYIYIETLKPAALEAFIMLLSFGWGDVIRGRFRPKGLGRRTGKRKGRWAKRLPRFPEIGNTLGKLIPIGEQIEDFSTAGLKSRFLWRIDNVIQGALFYWLVADVTIDFAFNWTSLLYKTEWCKASGRGRFAYHNNPFPGKSAGVWHKQAYASKDYEYPLPVWLFDGGGTGAYPCTVIASVEFRPYLAFAPPTNVQVKIFNPITGEIWAETGPMETNVDNKLSLPLKATVPANSPFEVRTWHGPSWAKVGGGIVTAQALGPD